MRAKDAGHMPEKISVGSRIRAARSSRGLSQPDLALRSGVPQKTISNIETGSAERSYQHLRSLCEALNVTADYLLGLTPYPGPLEPNTWLVDADLVDSVRSPITGAVPIDDAETIGTPVPRRPLILSATEYAALRRELMSLLSAPKRRRGRAP